MPKVIISDTKGLYQVHGAGVEFEGTFLHKDRVTLAKTGNYTIDANDSGYLITMEASATKTLTLPASAKGHSVTILNLGTEGAALRVDPNGTEKIRGNGAAGAAGKYIQTTEYGASVQLIADGSVGYIMRNVEGTWTRES